MIVDARTLPRNEEIETDICIIGGGASGITLAREFSEARFKVLLCESGGLRFKHRTQLLYRAENTGRPYYDMEFTKQRYFGGATNKWYGRCRPFDGIDFEERPWVNYSGWPFGKDELDPYYSRAHEVCQLTSHNYDPLYWQTPEKEQLALKGTPMETKIFHFSPPTRFGDQYLDELKRASNINILLYGNAVSVATNAAGKKVTHVNFTTLRGNKFHVKAKLFILAASALEVTRLLLVSNDVHSRGIGNHNDLVGRFFMEHPHIFSAVIKKPLTAQQSKFYKILDYDIDSGNLGTVGALGPTEDTLRAEKMLNASAFFIFRKAYKIDNRYFGRGGLALTQVMDTLNHTTAPGMQFFRYAGNTLKHINDVAGIIGQRFKGHAKQAAYTAIRSQLETEPNPDSRVTLSRRKDRFGMNRLKLDWQLTELDLRSFKKFNQLLCKGFRQAGYDIRLIDHATDASGWPVTMVAGKHHMGTTRMHSDPKHGVLDADCKVHDMANLFIAGSSMFPTSGQANPMLTIVALAIRLADHVKRMMSDPPSYE